ncbi:class I SAM-dependent methyltransferase [Orrella daihaiensis]|uniref:Methyltransferase domain-containing protein n=1 Tax=Orrella daihaiensis TaxID=2782176 RepID=A0ABY4ALH1_9BURK|nr:methyltransferase domain-containing protein [Orrella daihaiensis]UOD50793.1 methyltransferase domain-containing protein [Orrella daihaiensis]
MGEFSAQWLALREPVDHAARSARVRDVLLADLRKRHGEQLSGLSILDLGCGSGSNLRAIAPHLGGQQRWCLVDYDDALLDAARLALKAWAHVVVSETTDSLQIMYGDRDIEITFRSADLSGDLQTVLAWPADLVSASALFDLVSRQWVDRFCDALRTPLYAVLSFDGQMQWEPEHPFDQTVRQAFCMHQATDKGFGAALGPSSGRYLCDALKQRAFEVTIDKSPWQIEDLPSAFHDMLIDGIAHAVLETGSLGEADMDTWLAYHRRASLCLIGHDDLYASVP